MSGAKRDGLYFILANIAGVLYFGSLIFFSYVLIADSIMNMFSVHNLSTLIFIVIMAYIPLLNFIRNSAIIEVSSEKEILKFENYFTGKERDYPYEELDGYKTVRVPTYLPEYFLKYFLGNKFITHRVIWIVKDNRAIECIDERYVENYDELKEELRGLKNLGYQNIGLWNRIKMLFVPISID